MLKPLLLAVCAASVAAGCAVDRVASFNESTAAIDRTCLMETGTRIKAKDGECSAVVGRSYSKRELDRTGAFTTGEALLMLDPAVTLGR